jgi:hypothetical protein
MFETLEQSRVLTNFFLSLNNHAMKKTEQELNQLIDDLLVTAFEGGSNYWIDHVEVVGGVYGGYASDQISMGREIAIYGEDGKWILDRKKMIKGINAFLKHKGVKMDDLMEDHDAGDADDVLQFALFNELVYA